MIIKLNEHLFNYLKDEYLLKRKNLNYHIRKTNKNNEVKVELTDDGADEIRDWAGEQLQLKGFNENYELTAEGEMLQEIIELCYR